MNHTSELFTPREGGYATPATDPAFGGCVQKIGRHDNKEVDVVMT